MTITALIGDPVEHSVSNHLFAIYADKELSQYSHIKCRVDSHDPKNLETAIRGMKALGFSGCNVTLPFKLDVIPYLDEISEEARIMGAVNTIRIDGKKLIGFNTDGIGAIRSIDNYLKPISKEDKVVILGAGGAARAILYEATKRTNQITIINRSHSRLNKLEEDFTKIGQKYKYLELSKEVLISEISTSDYVINATSVGMSPDIERSLVSEETFAEINKITPIADKYFFDAIFNPYHTKFLKIASEKYNAKVCPGIFMMIYQGVEAFKIWTGLEATQQKVEKAKSYLKKLLS